MFNVCKKHSLRTLKKKNYDKNIVISYQLYWNFHSPINCVITYCSSDDELKMDMSSYKKNPLRSPLKDADFIEVIDSEESTHERY